MAECILSLIFNEIHTHDDGISLISTMEYMKDITLNYAAKGKIVTSRLECKSPKSEVIRKVMKLESFVKE